MTREEFAAALGRDPAPEDQLPGTYRYRARKGAPWQGVRISYKLGWWICLLNGDAEGMARDPGKIPFIWKHGPFHSITEDEYMAILKDYAEAQPGSPYLTPDQPVNLRRIKPL